MMEMKIASERRKVKRPTRGYKGEDEAEEDPAGSI